MTTLGKLFVLLNAAFSFVLLFWGLSLWHNRIDWSETKARGEQPPGEVAKLRSQIELLWAQVPVAEAAYREPRAAIAAMEKQRPLDRAWYAAELEHVRNGATAANPARSVVYEKGMPALDPKNFNRPQMVAATDRRNQPLQRFGHYENELNSARDSLVAELKKHQDLVEEDERLTTRLVGQIDPATKVVKLKGLRQRLIDERVKQQELVEEEKVVKPALVNAFVESQLVFKRAESLKARLEELERLTGKGVAASR